MALLFSVYKDVVPPSDWQDTRKHPNLVIVTKGGASTLVVPTHTELEVIRYAMNILNHQHNKDGVKEHDHVFSLFVELTKHFRSMHLFHDVYETKRRGKTAFGKIVFFSESREWRPAVDSGQKNHLESMEIKMRLQAVEGFEDYEQVGGIDRVIFPIEFPKLAKAMKILREHHFRAFNVIFHSCFPWLVSSNEEDDELERKFIAARIPCFPRHEWVGYYTPHIKVNVIVEKPPEEFYTEWKPIHEHFVPTIVPKKSQEKEDSGRKQLSLRQPEEVMLM